MIRSYLINCVILVVLVAGATAQPSYNSFGTGVYKEAFGLLTDRSHYISGETVHFSVFSLVESSGSPADWSKILYVELVTPEGASLDQKKIPLEKGGSKGFIQLPSAISSGTYYVRAYTRWMRNCGVESFSYTAIQVFDPFMESVIPVDTASMFARTPGPIMPPSENSGSGYLDCQLDKKVYHSREAVTATLNWPVPSTSGRFCISVSVPEAHAEQSTYHALCVKDTASGTTFIPEVLGTSLTGQVIAGSSGTPAAYATIYISILGENREFFCNYSDAEGLFYFSFPDYIGERDLFVSASHSDLEDLELLIDRDFSGDVLLMPSYPAALDSNMVRVVNTLSVNAQVASQYYPPLIQETSALTYDHRLFYGTPTDIIRFEDYINLPRLEEYFIEVVPQVSVKRTRGKRRFSLIGNHADLQIYQPLVMIDGVAIFDVDALLAVSPKLIDRIEIVNAPYIRGNVTFGGIISIISKNNDLGYIDLPSSGLLVNYQMFDPFLPHAQPVILEESHLPDVRNTLYWDPDLILNGEETASIRFYTSDTKGDYEILIRGYDSGGHYIQKAVPFTVK